ncbi:MAG: FkbM family methyltransferase [Verrucomicrobia bacterium]|nr:FkbM family methyltransferase [Verrucomicrobiota bacterium]
MKTQLVKFLYNQRWLFGLVRAVTPPVPVRLPDYLIYVRLSDIGAGLPIALRRSYEPHVTAAIRGYLKPGLVFLDLGANIGYYALLAAARVGASGKVIAFEPSPANCALQRRSIAANRFNNIQLHPYAVGDRDGEVSLSVDAIYSNACVSADGPPDSPNRVRAVTLDSFLKDEPRVDVVKMDIEGFEGRALSGMADLIRRHRPVIFAEFCPGALSRRSNIQPAEFLRRLREPGYDLSVVEKNPPGQTTVQTDAGILARFQAPDATDHIDLLALPEGYRSR